MRRFGSVRRFWDGLRRVYTPRGPGPSGPEDRGPLLPGVVVQPVGDLPLATREEVDVVAHRRLDVPVAELASALKPDHPSIDKRGEAMTVPEFSNWRRWGDDDQLGALNLMTPERIRAAIGLVKRGVLYNLAVPLEKDGPQFPTFHKTCCVSYFTMNHAPGAANFADDIVTMESHSGTHIDALGHYWRDGQMWNGRGAENVTGRGLEWAGIQNVPGVVARGIMLDLPRLRGVQHLALGEVVTVETIEACARAQRVEIGAGAVLLIRTGWNTLFHGNREVWNQGEPGPDVTCARWLKEKDVMAIGADNPAVEGYIYRERTPLTPRLHTVALRDLGIYLMENLNLEDLARDEVYEFLFVGAPLRLMRASGAPFSPLAVA